MLYEVITHTGDILMQDTNLNTPLKVLEIAASGRNEGSVSRMLSADLVGALAGVVGSLQAVEVVKELLGIGEGLSGRLLLYDARNNFV